MQDGYFNLSGTRLHCLQDGGIMEHWKQKISLFLTSQAISLLGSSLVQYAIIWYITLTTQSGVMMTLSTLCGVIPQVIISPFAGVWADRYNKKMLIMVSDGMIAISTLIIALCFLAGIDSVWLLFVVLAIRSLGTGVQTPTTTAFIPEVVPEGKLMKINGINSTIQSIMLILSPALSGALLANFDLGYIFFIDVITAVIGIGIFSFVTVPFRKKNAEKIDYFQSIKEGISYTKENKLITKMLVYLMIFNFLIVPFATLTPLLVTRTFGAEAWYLTVNEMVFFVGSIIGGVLISTWGGFHDRVKTIGIACLICGLFGILLGMPFHFVFYLVCIGVMGITMPFMNTPFITMFQETVDTDKQGRIFALITMLTGAIMPLGMILYGPLADIVKIEYILIITGVLFVVGTCILLRDQTLRKMAHESGQKEEKSTI